MGPLRKSKRARTKPPTENKPSGSSSPPPLEQSSSSTANPSVPVAETPSDATHKQDDVATLSKPVKPEATSSKSPNMKSSWYGTWPRKSLASTQVARESILADKPTNSSTIDLSRFEPKKSPATTSAPTDARPPSMYLGKSRETSEISRGGGVSDVDGPADKGNKTIKASSLKGGTPTVDEGPEGRDEPSRADEIPARPATSSGWLGGWLSRPAGYVPSIPDKAPEVAPTVEVGERSTFEEQIPEPGVTIHSEDAPNSTVPHAASSSWFGLWPTAAPSNATEAPKEEIPVKIRENDGDAVISDVPTHEASSPEQAVPAAGSSWAFWSSEPSKKSAEMPNKPATSGEVAVTGDASQDKPQPSKTATVKQDKQSKPNKRGRSQSSEIDAALLKTSLAEPSKAAATSSPAAKSLPPNLLIPSVKSTYRLIENPSILKQIARLLLRGHQQPVKHVSLTKDLPKIRKALAIGIHGLFPAPLLRTVIGQPTGTSIRFANHGAEAIRRWTEKHGSVDCEIEKVALEGEGKIAERVDNLWKLLLNWIDHVRKADFVLVSCHSQGVPVALMLVAKLIEFGVVTNGKIGVCAMAGVSLGPFSDYKSRLFSGSAGELFEFADPESAVSKRYEESLKVAMKYGVRVTYCGSIDDQLVSLESSIFSTVSHPYIFRAVFVDGRIHAPDFLSHLVGFALKLRNLGVSDHGLIRELSAPLAGSLYTGAGHSRLYDDGNVYDLAVEYALETTSVGDVPIEIRKYEIPTNGNPYVLPWIMRGLLEEDFVKTELNRETTELLKQFDDWKPATKVLKDVKYRLEAVRSKL